MKKDLVFATKETIIQPKGGLVLEDIPEEDHVLGGPVGPEFDVLVNDGHWANYAPTPELQKNRFGDTFMCVSYSNNNIHEFLSKKMYGEEINMSDIALGVMSGTVRGVGNSKRAVAETKRLSGFIFEKDYPYTSEMTLDQAYAPLSKELLSEAAKNLEVYAFLYKRLADNKPQTNKEGLKYSPLQVDVCASYVVGKNGYVIWNPQNPTYAHEVVVFDYEEGKCWWVFDSETLQYLKFDWNYPFGSPMIHALKKSMKIQIFKKTGSPALAIKHCSEASMIAFSGGSVQGGDLFKSLYGVSDFKQIPITEVKEWPFPIRHLINTNPQR